MANTHHSRPTYTQWHQVNPRLVTLCACLAQITIVLDTTIIAVALPDAQADLGFADADRQWTVTAYTLAFGSLLLLGGRLTQRLGARTAFLIGASGFGVASLLGGLATSFGMLVAFRALQGVFAALLAPTNLSIMNGAFPGTAGRAKAFAVFGSVAGAGAALGLLLGGLLTETLDWRWCFYVNVPLTMLTLIVAMKALRGTAAPLHGTLFEDFPGLCLGTTAIFSIVFGFSRAESEGWGHPITLTLLFGGIVLVVLFVQREFRTSTPIVPLRLLADFRRASSYLTIALVGLAQMGSSIYLTFYLQQNLGYSPFGTGLAFLPMVGGLVVAAVVSTRFIVPKLGIATAFIAGPVTQGVGFLWLSGLGTEDAYTQDLLGPIIVIGFGLGTVMAPAMSSATHGVRARESGLASALANTSQQFGASLGVAFLSTLATSLVTNRMEETSTDTATAVTSAIGSAGVAPTSVEAEQITDKIIATALQAAEVSAYSAGFIWLAAICGAVAVIVGILFLALGSRTQVTEHHEEILAI